MVKCEGNAKPIAGLSLVLATLGRTDEIGRFFSSIGGAAIVPLEVIVVDQNNDDRLLGIVAAARQQGIAVNHIRVARKGLSYARNIGLREARYDLVGFPDDDCWYEPHACESICAEFRSDSLLDGLVARWVDRHHGYTYRIVIDAGKQREFRGIPIASICLFFRTQVLRAAGDFDERFGVGEWFGSSEETDLVFRVLAAGHRICYCPEIGVRHFWSGASIELSGSIASIFRSAKLRARGTGAIYAKHSLGTWVVIKGLLAPATKAILPVAGLRGVAYWAGTFFGRMQGLIHWKSRQIGA